MLVGKPKLDPRKGTARIPVTVSAAATITLKGPKVQTRTVITKAAKSVQILVATEGKVRRNLSRNGRKVVRFRIAAAGSGMKSVRNMKIVLKSRTR